MPAKHDAASAMRWSYWSAPAKINLFLRIVGRRSDGYHDLQTVFQLLDWGDRIGLRRRADRQIRRLRGAVGVAENDDLAVLAARRLQAVSGVRSGADIDIEKRIPQGGGFGGGSSNAATVLLALNRLWGTGLSLAELAAVGLGLGADVPVFVHGHSAFAQGVGERLVPLQLPPRWYLLVDPQIPVSTAALFGSPDLTRDAPSTTISDLVPDLFCENAFEPVLRRLQPRVGAMLDHLRGFGRAGVTGSGSGLFVGFEREEAARTARARLPEGWRSWVARGTDVSSLRQELAQWSS